MRGTLTIAVGLALFASPALAGPNEDASLAMHTIVTDEYLYCSDEPGPHVCAEGMTCAHIDNSALAEEVDPGDMGYCYLVFLVYNFTNITAVEFCVDGWPVSRPAPPVPPMYYCPTSGMAGGSPWDGVGCMNGLACTVEPAVACGVFCFGYGVFNVYSLQDHWPVEIFYVPSTRTNPPGNKVCGPGPLWAIDVIDPSREHGCTIGGTHWEPTVYWDCGGPSGVETATWSSVKAMYR